MSFSLGAAVGEYGYFVYILYLYIILHTYTHTLTSFSRMPSLIIATIQSLCERRSTSVYVKRISWSKNKTKKHQQKDQRHTQSGGPAVVLRTLLLAAVDCFLYSHWFGSLVRKSVSDLLGHQMSGGKKETRIKCSIVLYCLALSCPVYPCLVLSCFVMSCLSLFCLDWLCLVLSSHVIPCLVLSCIVLSL